MTPHVRVQGVACLFATGSLLMPIAVNAAQDLQPPPPDPSAFEWSVSADVLRDLPAANVLAVLETMHAEVVSDRFNSGGLTAGGASHLVAPLGSRSQTRFRIGDVDITSPSSGEPMLFPELAFWNGIDIVTGLLPAQASAPSLAIGLDPARPAARWSGTVETSFSRPALVSGGSSSRPATGLETARLDGRHSAPEWAGWTTRQRGAWRCAI